MTAPFLPASLLGRWFGEWRVMQLLSSGGMGHVYALSDASRARHVALKLLRPELATKPSHRARFEREARAAGAVRHENVVRVASALTEEGGFVFFTMELLRGADVADTLAQRGALGGARAARIARGAAEGLAALHASGVVHRDVKPENLFLVHASDGGEVTKVIDFGSAHVEGPPPGRDAAPKPGTLGTPDYTPPEGLGESSCDPSLDVYGLGVVLHEMISGRPPLSGRLEVSVKDSPIADLVSRMLAYQPSERPSARDVADALSRGF